MAPPCEAMSAATGAGGGEAALLGRLDVRQRRALAELMSANSFDAARVEQHLWPGDSATKYALRILAARKFNVPKVGPSFLCPPPAVTPAAS